MSLVEGLGKNEFSGSTSVERSPGVAGSRSGGWTEGERKREGAPNEGTEGSNTC